MEFTFDIDGQSVTPVIDRNDLSFVTRAFATAGTYEVPSYDAFTFDLSF